MHSSRVSNLSGQDIHSTQAFGDGIRRTRRIGTQTCSGSTAARVHSDHARRDAALRLRSRCPGTAQGRLRSPVRRSSASGIVPRSLREACSGPAPGVKAPRACSGGRGDGDDRPHVVSRDPAGSPARNEFATTRSSASRRSSTCPISGASSTSPTASSSGRNSNSRDRLHVLPQRRRLAVPPLDDPPLSLDA